MTTASESMVTPTPAAVLAEVDRILGSESALAGAWQRACTWLIRLAIESALQEFWSRRLPEAASIPMRSQLLLLPHLLRDPGEDATAEGHVAAVAAEAARCWNGLSSAGHHRDYELAPTLDELRAWHASASRIVHALSVDESMSHPYE